MFPHSPSLPTMPERALDCQWENTAGLRRFAPAIILNERKFAKMMLFFY